MEKRNLTTETYISSNNTFDMEALNKTLQNVVVTNFWELYNIQRARFNIKTFEIPLRDFKRVFQLPTETSPSMIPMRYVYYIPYQFIESVNRRAYRKKTSIFEKIISQEEICQYPEIFIHNYLLFIDNKFVTTTEILPLEDKCGIIIDVSEVFHEDGIEFNKFDEMLKNDAKVTVMMIPKCNITDYNTNMHTIDRYKNRIPLSIIPNGDLITESTICLCNTSDNIFYLKEIVNFKIDYMTKAIEFELDNRFNFQDDNKPLRFKFINIKYVSDVIEVDYNNPYFTVDKKMPLPYEDIIVFSHKENETFSLNKSLGIDMYYPNIYKITGLSQNEKARAYIIYNDKDISDSEIYTNELSLYYKYAKNIMDKYLDESIPSLIKDYRPIKVEYSIDDYNNSMFVPYTFDYKVDKLRTFIKLDPNILTKYLVYQIGKTDEFYISIKNINLKDRYRTDTSKEFPKDKSPITFDEPQYVFNFRTQFLNWGEYSMRLFLDGIFLTENDYMIFEGIDYYFLYLPCSKVKEDSVLDIEKFKKYNFDQKVIFNDLSTPVDVIINSKDVVPRDIFIIDIENKHYISRSKYIIKMKIPQTGIECDLDSEGNTPLVNPLKIYIKDVNLLGRQLMIMVKKECSMQVYQVNESGQPKYQTFKTRAEMNNTINNYRVFRNGRLLPYRYFMMTFTNIFLDPASIIIKMQSMPNDVYTLDCTTNYYEEVLYDQNILHHKGYIDLTGRIDKPLNLKWYDIYVNGIKLTKDNISIISPTKMFIKNINSLKHLYITQKNRDDEIFYLEAEYKTINDKIFEQLDGLREDILLDYPEIQDTMEDLITELIDNMSEEIMIFFENYLKYTFIDPNLEQIEDNVKLSFPELIGGDHGLLLDANPLVPPDDVIDNVILINCNKRADIPNNVDNKDRKELGGMADRFGVSALFASPLNIDIAEANELMVDTNTGATLLKGGNGSIIPGSEIERLREKTEKFTMDIKMLGLINWDIYNLSPDDKRIITQSFNNNDNILDSVFIIDNPKQIKQLRFFIDLDYLKTNEKYVKESSNYIPDLEFKYMAGTNEKIVTMSLTDVNTKPIEFNSNYIEIIHIKIRSTVPNIYPEQSEFVLHSILMACEGGIIS